MNPRSPESSETNLLLEHFGGQVEVRDSAELEAVLQLRYGDGFNEFWVSGALRFPYIVIAVGPEGAALHFFPADEHPGFRSVGDRSKSGSAWFRTNTPQEKLAIAASSIISFELASAVACQFMRSHARPDLVEWEEL